MLSCWHRPLKLASKDDRNGSFSAAQNVEQNRSQEEQWAMSAEDNVPRLFSSKRLVASTLMHEFRGIGAKGVMSL